MTLLASIGTIALLSGSLTNRVDALVEGSLRFAPDGSGEISFVTDWPADVHWFGAYLRKGEDRYSIHPEPFMAGSYFAPEKPRGDGLNHFKQVHCEAGLRRRKHGADPLPRTSRGESAAPRRGGDSGAWKEAASKIDA